MTPDEILSRMLYKDQDVIVLDKPPGLAVHAGPNSPDHLELYLDALKFGWAEVPKLAHRLDRDTSGCLILGRHAKAIKRLGKMFEQRRVGKVYWSVSHGSPEGDSGTVDAPLLKVSARGQGWRIKVDPAGQPSITDWSVLGRGDGLSWIEWRPRTGRTHQIRIHAQHLGCPLLGDAYYGPDPETQIRLHLLAREVSFPALAPSKEPIRVTAPPPAHMREALRACGWREDTAPS